MFIPYITKVFENSSPCWNSIPGNIVKPSIKYYIKSLRRLVNYSFESGIFPDELKMTNVIPIYKSRDITDITNYRPIYVLPFFPRLLKKIMQKYLINLIDKHNILYRYQ